MTAALFGAAAVMVAAVCGMFGVLATGRSSGHLADVTGLGALVDQLQEERDYWRTRCEACEREHGR